MSGCSLERELQGFRAQVERDVAAAGRELDAEESETLELMVRVFLKCRPLRAPRQASFEQWTEVLDRLVSLGYVETASCWYHPTVAGFRRALLHIDAQADAERGQPVPIPPRGSYYCPDCTAACLLIEPCEHVAITEDGKAKFRELLGGERPE